MHEVKGPLPRDLGARLGAGRASSATPRSPPTWRCPGSGRSTSATSPSATCKRELKDAAEPEGQLTLDGLGPSEADVAAEAAHADVLKAVAVNDLSDALETVLGQRGGDALLGGIELPLTRVLAAMEYRGIAADVDYLQDAAAGVRRRRSPPRPPSATPSSAAR